MSDHELKKIEACNNAIDVAATLLIAFTLDDAAGGGIPQKIKNEYIRAGLLDAILVAVDQSDNHLQWLRDKYKSQRERVHE
jgi:hypothetical protein